MTIIEAVLRHRTVPCLSSAYDAEERITSVTETYVIDEATVTNTTAYTYDEMGRLLTETVNGTAVNTMTYDAYGNILTKNGVSYEYDSVWKDRLKQVGTEFTVEYDDQGNPTSYLGHTLNWEKGRQLKSFDNNTYAYNANGIRTSKTVNGIKHSFALDGSKILREEWCGNTLIPLYDNADSVCGVMYNGISYFFLKNLQGDVIAITDSNGDTVARYSYDAWGACTVTQDSSNRSIATVNPYRYRGYYFDSETELYYLQSRYYDPSVGRFINADSPDYAAITGGNLYAYCGNCPTKNADYAGFCYTPSYDEESKPYISNKNSESKIKEICKALLPNVYSSKGVQETTMLDLNFFKIVAVGGGSVQTNGSAIIGFLQKNDEIETSLFIPIGGIYSLGLSSGRKGEFNTFTIALYTSLKCAYSSIGIKFYFSPIRFLVASAVAIAYAGIQLQYAWMKISQALLKALPYAILAIIIAALIYFCPYLSFVFI